MKKYIVLLVTTIAMVSCASYTIDGKQVTKEEYSVWAAQKVEQNLASRQFVINMKSMHPFRGNSPLPPPYGTFLTSPKYGR